MATKGEGIHPLDPGSDETRASGLRGLTAPPHTPRGHTRAHTSLLHGGWCGGVHAIHQQPAARRANRDQGPRPSRGGARGRVSAVVEIPPAPPGAPHQRVWPGGRGAEGRGDIIRAAPPPAATIPQARRSIHDIIGLISTPLTPGTPSSGTHPLPSSRSDSTSLAVQRAQRQVGAARSAAEGLPHLLAASGSGAGSSARAPPAPLAGAARSPPGGARGAGPARLRAPPAPRPGPAHPWLRQTRARPPATPPEPANPRSEAGRNALTPSSLHTGPRMGPSISPTLGLRESAPRLPADTLLTPKALGLSPQSLLFNKSSRTAPSLNLTSLATRRNPLAWERDSRRQAPSSSSPPLLLFRARPPSGRRKTLQICKVGAGRAVARGTNTAQGISAPAPGQAGLKGKEGFDGP